MPLQTLLNGVIPQLSADSALWEVVAMIAFSVWKTYMGPLMAALLGYNYWQMLLCNLPAAMASSYLTLWIDGWLRARRRENSQGFSRYLRRALRFWRVRGEAMVAWLSPVLIGIPVYALVAQRLRSSRGRVLWTTALATTFWCTLIYFGSTEIMRLLSWWSATFR